METLSGCNFLGATNLMCQHWKKVLIQNQSRETWSKKAREHRKPSKSEETKGSYESSCTVISLWVQAVERMLKALRHKWCGGEGLSSQQNGEAGFSLDVYWCVMKWGALLKAGTGVDRGFRRTDTHLPNASREFVGCFSRGREAALQQFSQPGTGWIWNNTSHTQSQSTVLCWAQN